MIHWGTVFHFSLVAGGSICLVTLWLLIHQKRFSIFASLFTYLNLLLFLEIMATLIIPETSGEKAVLIAYSIRLITGLFIPLILFTISYGAFAVREKKNPLWLYAATWTIATALAIPAFRSFYFHSLRTESPVPIPQFSSNYWLVIGYLFLLFAMTLITVVALNRRANHSFHREKYRFVITILLPLFFIYLGLMHIFPYWGIFHPAFVFLYPLAALVIFYTSLYFQILPLSPRVQFSLPYLIIFIFLLLVFYLIAPPFTDYVLHYAIVVILSLAIISGTELTLIIYHQSSKSQAAFHQALEKQLANFTDKISSYLEPDKFWEYVGHFCHTALGYERCAIVAFQYDVQPYRVVYVNQFNKHQFQDMLTQNPSVILDEIEEKRTILFQHQYESGTVIHEALKTLGIEVIAPIFEEHALAGIIFLGQATTPHPIQSQLIHQLSLFTNHVAIAYRNLKIIRKTMQAQKMAEIGMLASQLAHDFQSFITLVKLENSNNARITEHAQYMEKLVSDLMQFVRPQELKLTPININDLIDMTLDLLEIPPDVIIEKHYAEDLPDVHVDINEMRRVFINLFENSLRAMQNADHKRIKITTRRLRPISRFQLSPWLYIEILDEGEGIPEELLTKIFDPFFTTYKHRGGNGLGLAIVKQIVTRHQGYIDVASRPGKGTIFSIRIPFLLH